MKTIRKQKMAILLTALILMSLFAPLPTFASPSLGEVPIIIIPGILGSRLFADAACKDPVWSPDSLTTSVIRASEMEAWKTVYVRLPIDFTTGQHTVIYDREFGAQNQYRNLVQNCLPVLH